jgi:hypothetical protein
LGEVVKRYDGVDDRIADLACPGEVEGFKAQMMLDRTLTPAIENKLAIRLAQIKGEQSGRR